MIERNGITFQVGGFGLTPLEGDAYTIEGEDELVHAYAHGKTKQEVLETAEEVFGRGLTVK